jgi:hypothetical protein
MSEESDSGLDPFCQRSSIEIATDIGDEVGGLCNDIEQVYWYTMICTSGFGVPEEHHEFIRSSYDRAVKSVEIANTRINQLGEKWNKISYVKPFSLLSAFKIAV